MTDDAVKKILEGLIIQDATTFWRVVKKLRAKKRTVEYKRMPIPRRWVERAYKQQHGICPLCSDNPMPYEGWKNGEVVGDHKNPLAHGGEHEQRNIQAVHAKCNKEKSSKSILQQSKETGKQFTEIL